MSSTRTLGLRLMRNQSTLYKLMNKQLGKIWKYYWYGSKLIIYNLIENDYKDK